MNTAMKSVRVTNCLHNLESGPQCAVLFFLTKHQEFSFSKPFFCQWTRLTVICWFQGCWQGCRHTLHWQRVHSVPCLIQEEPLKREMSCSSVHVLVMSLRMVSAWQGSVTQRGQHSPSGTTVNSQSTGGHGRGQQSTCPCCSAGGRDRQTDQEKERKVKIILANILFLFPGPSAVVYLYAGESATWWNKVKYLDEQSNLPTHSAYFF